MILLGLFQLVSRGARAEAPKLAWQGPDCLAEQAAFEARLSALVKPADAARLSGRVAVAARGGGFEVQLSLALGARALGQRRFRAATCKAAAETAAVAAAMAAFSEEAAAPAAEPAPEAPPAVTEARAPNTTEAPPPKPDLAPSSSRGFARPAAPAVLAQPRVGLLLFTQTGVLPSPVLGGVLELGVGLGKRWSLAVQGGVTAAQERAQGAGRSTFWRVLAGAARGCFAPFAAGRLRVDACSGVQLLWIRGHGQGFDVDHTASLATAAPLLALDLSLKAPEFVEWRVQAEGSTPLSRRRFFVDGREAARAAALTFSARFGPIVRF
ncbi:MAG: hypothetical protein ABUL60_33435 [Myxococcales bacterium]